MYISCLYLILILLTYPAYSLYFFQMGHLSHPFSPLFWYLIT